MNRMMDLSKEIETMRKNQMKMKGVISETLKSINELSSRMNMTEERVNELEDR